MSFQLILFLYAYYVFLFVWLFFSVVAVYHMIRFGFKNTTTFITTIIFLTVALTLLLISLDFIFEVDWSTSVEILPGITSQDVII